MLTIDVLTHRAEHLGKSFKKRLKLFDRQQAELDDRELDAEGDGSLGSSAKFSKNKGNKGERKKGKKLKAMARERVDWESLRRQAVEVADLEVTLGGWGDGQARALVVDGEVLAAELSVGQAVALKKWLKRLRQMYASVGRVTEVARVEAVAGELDDLLERWRSEEVPTVRVGEAVVAFVERGE
ncbi:hypothetical protein FRC96_16900 [Lujinxingia vulgaris]|uniref:Uncharacterized protein n=1 Tax=Lujinxingia vulgaris TaxID=2600176 RepID=A0A5C6X7P8_9DELT|nr:hypothetical protein [Lujinxingia vulgaris]TXD32644.1 hypothetical protein FRC96_16900 [Lujinxingia vulgaris]